MDTTHREGAPDRHETSRRRPKASARLWGPQTKDTLSYLSQPSVDYLTPVYRALAGIKLASTTSALEFGLLDEVRGGAIRQAATEAVEGLLDEHFVIGWLQVGSGTSANMNVNEVLAARANQILQNSTDPASYVHPNDHVNLGQSSNDVFPTAIHLAVLHESHARLLPALDGLVTALRSKADETTGVTKAGRTHMVDAAPVTLGQEFSGYARQIELAADGIRRVTVAVEELPLGGTAVGTGLNAIPGMTASTIAHLRSQLGLQDLREAANHFEAQGARDALVAFHGACRSVAVAMSKIASDVRLMASGPRAGLGEIRIPDLPPRSSIMPGKGTPAIAELVTQSAAQVMGNDVAVGVGGMSGQFELNAYAPLIAKNVMESVDLLTKSAQMFAGSCIDGIEADTQRCFELAESSLALAASLVPVIGYDRASELVALARERGASIRETALSQGSLSADEIERILDVAAMTQGGRA